MRTMKYKLIKILYLCLCASLVVRSDDEGEEEEEEESGSGEEDESAEENWLAGSKDMKDMGRKIAEKAIERQFEIMEEQQKKGQEFVNEKMDIDIQPEKGWKTEDVFVPPGFRISAELTGEDEKPEGEAGEQPYIYPMGVGGILMNGCFGTNYQPGDPCYEAFWETTLCHSLIDGAAFIGVGFDGRGDDSQESRKMSIVQRDCSGRATYDDFDVPDTMNVHGVYDTSATMQTFYSREEYQQSLQQQSGISGSIFGFYAGVKKAWGSSSLKGAQKYMALFSIDIDRYEIYLDEVKPGDLSVNFLREFMDLPLSYFAPGAAMKFQNFILRWGTHYITSGKFGGRLQIRKTMEASQVSSKQAFSQVMEMEFRSLFASFHAKKETSGSSSQRQQKQTSSTSIKAEGGDQEIAALITDFNSPTIKTELKQWLESIRTFPKPYKFMLAPITDLLKFNAHSLFPHEERDWGCEARKDSLKKDPDTGENYYEVEVDGNTVRKFCKYLDRESLMYDIERRRNSLERAIGVYMEEGPISATEISLPSGPPGCQTKNYNFQERSSKPSWKAMTEDGITFKVIFGNDKAMYGRYHGMERLLPQTEKYVRFYRGRWFSGETAERIDLKSACNWGGSFHVASEDRRICILGMVLRYDSVTGFLILNEKDFGITKQAWPTLTEKNIDSVMARVEWPGSEIFKLDEVIGYVPCNVKWSNAMRFDPSEKEGKCLHFILVSEGTAYVIFSAVPNDKNAWYYVQISSHGVGIYKSQKLMVSTLNINAVGLGNGILYQSYFVCVKESSEGTLIEYGKSQGFSENRDVFLSMYDKHNPLYSRFYSFGNGEDPVQVVDVHVLSRRLSNVNCRGDTMLDEETNLCVQDCNDLCDPAQGCRGSPSGTRLASDCNACLYGKNEKGECLAKE